jgi:hypothetical protein
VTAAKIIEEIKRLPPDEQVKIVEYIQSLEAKDIPESFREGMKDVKAGRVVDMKRALFEPYPGDEKRAIGSRPRGASGNRLIV